MYIHKCDITVSKKIFTSFKYTMYCYTMYGISIMVLIVAYDEQFNFVQLSSMRFIKKGPREAQMKNLKDEQINLYAHDYQNDYETIEFGLHTFMNLIFSKI